MLHACVQRFDVTENLKKFCKILGTKQALNSLRPLFFLHANKEALSSRGIGSQRQSQSRYKGLFWQVP